MRITLPGASAIVKGLDIFRDRFSPFEGSFILIGGAACDLWFDQLSQPFRATQDLDLVLLVEVISPEFVRPRPRNPSALSGANWNEAAGMFLGDGTADFNMIRANVASCEFPKLGHADATENSDFVSGSGGSAFSFGSA